MKKFYNRNFAYGAAALLIGAVSFTACSSEDELSNTNPTYDGESVKTQFAINIPAAAKTRMTGEYTQAGWKLPRYERYKADTFCLNACIRNRVESWFCYYFG